MQCSQPYSTCDAQDQACLDKSWTANATTEVFDSEFKYIYEVPSHLVVHLPPSRLNITRLVVCRNYHARDSASCAMGENCKFVHIDCDCAELEAHPIHVNYIWRHEDCCTYPRLPPGDVLEVLLPNMKQPAVLIPSQRILKTRGSIAYKNWVDAAANMATVAQVGAEEEAEGEEDGNGVTETDDSAEMKPHQQHQQQQPQSRHPLSHCAHYYYNRMCNRGERCNFIHAIYVDPSVRGSFKRAPARCLRWTVPQLESGVYYMGDYPVAPSSHALLTCQKKSNNNKNNNENEKNAINSAAAAAASKGEKHKDTNTAAEMNSTVGSGSSCRAFASGSVHVTSQKHHQQDLRQKEQQYNTQPCECLPQYHHHYHHHQQRQQRESYDPYHPSQISPQRDDYCAHSYISMENSTSVLNPYAEELAAAAADPSMSANAYNNNEEVISDRTTQSYRSSGFIYNTHVNGGTGHVPSPANKHHQYYLRNNKYYTSAMVGGATKQEARYNGCGCYYNSGSSTSPYTSAGASKRSSRTSMMPEGATTRSVPIHGRAAGMHRNSSSVIVPPPLPLVLPIHSRRSISSSNASDFVLNGEEEDYCCRPLDVSGCRTSLYTRSYGGNSSSSGGSCGRQTGMNRSSTSFGINNMSHSSSSITINSAGPLRVRQGSNGLYIHYHTAAAPTPTARTAEPH